MTTSTAGATHQTVSTRAPSMDAGVGTSSTGGRNCLLELTGQMTWRTSRRLHVRFRRAVDTGGRDLRVDLCRVTEVDPAGIAVLLVYARLLPTLGGTLELSNISAACRALMREMQLSHLLAPSLGTATATAAAASFASQQSPDRWMATVSGGRTELTQSPRLSW